MVIVIGSTGGLGAGLCCYWRERPELLEPLGTLAPTVRRDLDMESEESIAAFFHQLARTLSAEERLYIVNATGCSINGIIHRLTTESLARTIQVNLTSNVWILKYLRPLVENQREAAVVLLGSVVSELGVPGAAAYGASKSALHGLVRGAAKEFARFGTRINCIDLGYFDRGMIRDVPPDMLQQITESIPMKRLGMIEDLAHACDFALRCRYLTGTVIRLNGGLQ